MTTESANEPVVTKGRVVAEDRPATGGPADVPAVTLAEIRESFRAVLSRAITEVTGRAPSPEELDARSEHDLAEVFREFGPEYLSRIAAAHRNANPSQGAVRETQPVGTSLSPEELKEAESAIWYAKVHGIKSITKALEWHLEHGDAAHRAPCLRVCADEYHIVKRCEGRAAGTRYVYRKRLAPFLDRFGDRQPLSIAPEDIADHLSRWARPTTKAAHWEALSTFFQWLVKMRYALVNPVPLALKRPRPKGGARLIFTPEEAEFILRETMYSDQIGYWVLALFAGLRISEIEWIHTHPTPWHVIQIRSRRIDLGKLPAKTSRRVVPITRALRTWLNWVRARDVPLYPPNFWAKFRQLRARTLGPRYVDPEAEAAGKGGRMFGGTAVYSMARRSYLAYHVALTGVSAAISDEVGNSEAFVRAHFSGKATPEDARRYFGLSPKVVGRAIRRTADEKLLVAPPVSTSSSPPDGGTVPPREFYNLSERLARLENTVATLRDAQFGLLPGHYGFKDAESFLAAVRAATRRRPGIVTDDLRKEVHRLTRVGQGGREIARQLSISRTTVYDVQRELGVGRRAPRR